MKKFGFLSFGDFAIGHQRGISGATPSNNLLTSHRPPMTSA